MTTELSTVLREAVADAPPDDYDVLDVVEAGARRVRRRTTLVVGLSALVATAAVTALALGGERPAPEPAPADVVRLDLAGAERLDLDVLASVRSTSRGGTDLEREQFEGMTTDGLVLRSRYSNGGAKYELGLLDPETGTTDWLPPPPVAARQVVELTSDRLVLLGPWAVGPGSVLVFDRGSQTWERTRISLPEGVEVHVPPHLEIAPDGRLHLGSNMEGESGPIYWWSYALPVGGVESAEPDLTGAVVAWRDGVRATVDNEGRVVVSTAGTERLLADERPAGCDRASDPDEAEMPLWLDLAGDRPVVTYWCGDDFQPVTLVYDTQGGSAVQVAGAAVRAVDRRHVLLSATTGSPEGVYLLDLDRRTLAHIGSQPHEMQLALADGLVLWNQAGPSDDEDVYDVVWKVARLPLRD